MKIVIDTLGAPALSGGMRLYAEELIRAWLELPQADELHVVGYPWVEAIAAHSTSVHLHMLSEGARQRVFGQWLIAPWVARSLGADALLATSPIVGPGSGRPRVCVVHDWRHLNRPQEFGRPQRLYRRWWSWSAGSADLAVQISEKTDRETARFVPQARRLVVPNGADHPRRWSSVHPDSLAVGVESRPLVVTFGHHANKRPDLMVRALAEWRASEAGDPRLIVLGVRGALADTLRALAEGLGVGDRVFLPGFVPEEEYRSTIQRADIVALVSSDEGFGLPAVEAAYFGIPVICTTDSGLAEIHEGVIAVPPEPGAIADALACQWRERKPVRAGHLRSWGETAAQIRAAIEALVIADQAATPGQGKSR